MTRKSTFLGSIFLDWDLRNPDGVINDRAKTQSQWETGVINTLQLLYSTPPCRSSTAVIDALRATGKTVTIVPFTLKPHDTAGERLKAKLNAGAVADDIPAATVPGKRSDELPDWAYQQIAAAPEGPERDKVIARFSGTGAGSDSKLYFTAQDWATASGAAGLDAVDETLLHELVHSLRQAKGQEDPDHLLAPFPVLRGGEKDDRGNDTPQTQLSQRYDTLEEFAAIVITNIYRSENGRQGLRRHHLVDDNQKDPPLAPPLTNPRTFLTVWRAQLERLQRELPLLCDQIAPIDCPFNPLFELYAAQNRFAPGTRRVLAKPWADPR
ncbi:MAG: hypothetical protein U1F68_19675 [Gammaproteobacteria bacterium]